MFGFVRTRGISLHHPLGEQEFPEKLAASRLDELVTKLRKGEITVGERDELAHGHIRLAISIASCMATRAPHLVDVLVAEAMWGIVKALDVAREKLKDNNITPFISTRVQSACFRALTKSSTVNVPYSTIKGRKERGLDTPIPLCSPINKNAQASSSNMYELRDMLDSCVKQTLEREVLKLRSMGYNDREISDMLKASRTSVRLARKSIEERYDAMQLELDS